ncbi:hypothetical protein J2Z76_002701 [Sedimentibacter acidaminivorans]|uniref:Uncharacterized protein n=1 Tax=Sedimentibacter acidaminivorans TaxID=913099 RepID=A0ABS4GGL3_9FIRM|nr:hypothetical protein [Sedimentibacter acidaminivorans]MBP1926831.1 hypothetical protein [Sedimentibacter acidaminivorans]
MFKWAYFNACFDVSSKNIVFDKKILFSITKNDYKNNRIIDVDRIIFDCKIEELVNRSKKNMLNQIEDTPSADVDDIKQIFNSYYKGIQEGLKLAFNNNVIESVIIFYPFFRISNINGQAIYTYFTLVNYFNNKKEFWVTEGVPDISEINESKESFKTYINNLIFEVRNSLLVNSNVYEYIPKREKCNFNNEMSFTYNYILAFFIKENFNLDISNLEGRVSISSFGELILNINKKKNKKKDILLNEKILQIAIKDYKVSTYFEYLERTSSNLFFYEIVRTMYNSFLSLNKKKKLYKIDEIRKSLIGKFLNNVMSKEKIRFSEDVNILIKEEKTNENKEFLNLISMALGYAYGGYKNTQE